MRIIGPLENIESKIENLVLIILKNWKHFMVKVVHIIIIHNENILQSSFMIGIKLIWLYKNKCWIVQKIKVGFYKYLFWKI